MYQKEREKTYFPQQHYIYIYICIICFSSMIACIILALTLTLLPLMLCQLCWNRTTFLWWYCFLWFWYVLIICCEAVFSANSNLTGEWQRLGQVGKWDGPGTSRAKDSAIQLLLPCSCRKGTREHAAQNMTNWMAWSQNSKKNNNSSRSQQAKSAKIWFPRLCLLPPTLPLLNGQSSTKSTWEGAPLLGSAQKYWQ